jgi:UrcA family protein
MTCCQQIPARDNHLIAQFGVICRFVRRSTGTAGPQASFPFGLARKHIFRRFPMRCLSSRKCGLGAGVVCVSLGLGLVAAAAQGSPYYGSDAQGVPYASGSSGQGAPYNYGSPYNYGPSENVIVVAPRLRIETQPLNGTLGRAWLSTDVRYDDLDIATRAGANELRGRIWRAANEVCDRLADAYPVRELTSDRGCLRGAYENGMVRAYGVINNARLLYWTGYNAGNVRYTGYTTY